MKKLYILIIPIIFASCTANQKIAYKTNDIQAAPRSIPISVCIKELSDIRQDGSENSLLFEENRVYKGALQKLCINSEKHYKNETVTLQVSRQIAEHFQKANLFNKTTFEDDSQIDYYITGKLSYFYGVQDFSNAAATGRAFGLIGALATMNTKSNAEIIIEIKDIALYDKDGVLVKEIGDFRKDYSGELRVDADCWCIYNNINDKLKEFNDDLMELIRTELQNANY